MATVSAARSSDHRSGSATDRARAMRSEVISTTCHQPVGRIAILVAGPFRYAHLVLPNLERFLPGLEFDVFFHIWKSDLGNKVRVDEEWSIDELQGHPRAKAVTIASPYPESFYGPTIGTKTNSNSSINATMGMFFSMSSLCSYVSQLPDSEEYTHMMRLRTDCPIISRDFVRKIDFHPDVITVSLNPSIPEGWISDHITFAARHNFLGLWYHRDIQSIFQSYRAGERNPEQMLSYLSRHRLRGVTIREALLRDDDYTIVYNPPLEQDLDWIKRAVAQRGPRALFEDPESCRDECEIAAATTRRLAHRAVLTRHRLRQSRSGVLNRLLAIARRIRSAVPGLRISGPDR